MIYVYAVFDNYDACLYYCLDNFDNYNKEKKLYEKTVKYCKDNNGKVLPTNIFIMSDNTNELPYFVRNGKKVTCTFFKNKDYLITSISQNSCSFQVFESDLEPSQVYKNIYDIIPEYFL